MRYKKSGLDLNRLPADVRDFIEEATARREGTFDELKINVHICDVTGDFLGYRAVYFKDMAGYRDIVDSIEMEK